MEDGNRNTNQQESDSGSLNGLSSLMDAFANTSYKYNYKERDYFIEWRARKRKEIYQLLTHSQDELDKAHPEKGGR